MAVRAYSPLLTRIHPPVSQVSLRGSGLRPGPGGAERTASGAGIATEHSGLQGRGVLDTRDWGCREPSPVVHRDTGHSPGRRSRDSGYMVRRWRCSCGEWVLLSGEGSWAGPRGVGAALKRGLSVSGGVWGWGSHLTSQGRGCLTSRDGGGCLLRIQGRKPGFFICFFKVESIFLFHFLSLMVKGEEGSWDPSAPSS